MTQINSFNRQSMRNNELLTFYREVENFIQGKQAADKLNIETLFTTYQAALEAYATAIVTVSKSALTEQIEAADKERDNLFVGICETIRTGTRHFRAATAQAAKNLMPVVNTYAGISSKSLDDETGYINNFISQLCEDKYVSDIENLDLAEWIESLDDANSKVSRLSVQRTNEKVASGASTGAGMKTRTEVNSAYDTMVQMLNALCMVNGETNYKATFEVINARIKHYQDVLAQRKGKAGSKQKEEEVNTTSENGMNGEE